MKDQQKGAVGPWAITVAGILILLFIIFFLFFFFSRSQPTQNAPATTGSFAPLNSSSSPFDSGQVNHQTLGNIPYPSTAVPNAPVSNVPVQAPTQVAPQQNYQIETVQNAPISYAPFVTDTVATQNTDYAPALENAINNLYTPTLVPLAMNTSTTAQPTQTVYGNGGSGGGGGSEGSTIAGVLVGLAGCGAGLLVAGPVGCVVGGLLGGTIMGLAGGGGAGSILGGLSGGLGGGGGGGGGSFGTLDIKKITECTCNSSRLLQLENNVTGQTIELLVSASTDVRSYANSMYGIQTGMKAEGNYSSGGGQCEVYKGEECESEGSPQGTITLMGTSAQ